MREKEANLRTEQMLRDKEKEQEQKKIQNQEREMNFKMKIKAARKNQELEEKSLQKRLDL